MQLYTKGVGGFSRNLIAAAVIAICGTAAAQTGPNKVYLEQIGNSNTITVEQVGATNNVGGTAGNVSVDGTGVTTLTPSTPSTANYATVTGSNNTVSLNQTGSNNSAQYNITGSNNAYTSNITGDNNQTRLVMGSGNATANYNTVTETVAGNNNLIMQNVQASNVISTTSITGSTNQVTKDLQSNRGTSNVTIGGNNNVITAEQTGVAGANGHSLINTVSGDFNSITTQQQGGVDTTVNLQTTGSFNTITVRSSDAAIVNPKTAIQR
jgi:hypothetical protein